MAEEVLDLFDFTASVMAERAQVRSCGATSGSNIGRRHRLQAVFTTDRITFELKPLGAPRPWRNLFPAKCRAVKTEADRLTTVLLNASLGSEQ